MEQTLHQLGELLLGAIPTVIIFVLLHFYLRGVLYRPFLRVLHERASRTEDRFETARQRMAQADTIARQYEEELQAARLDAYKQIEARRGQAMTRRSALVSEARSKAEAALRAAREQITADTVDSQRKLRLEADQLGNEMVAAILHRSVASRPTAQA
jgi:F-type H+-transporting ATPase subunit b